MRSVEVSKLNILNRFFTRNTLRDCLIYGNSSTYEKTLKKYKIDIADKTNSQVMSEVYDIMKKHYRNEYFYKNTLLNKLLLGVHSINTTTALTELPIANSKADFLLINGKAVVYEIKTELDNLERLENQINDYYKAFDHVSVVTCEKNISELLKKIDALGKPVGIYVLRKSGVLSAVRKPESYKSCIDKDTLFKLLRKYEYEEIILKNKQTLPDVSAFGYYQACREMFLDFPIEVSYPQVLKVLKQRSKILDKEFRNVPYELKFLAYFMDLKNNDYKKMNYFLGNRCGGV